MTRAAAALIALLLAACGPVEHVCGPIDTDGPGTAERGIDSLGAPFPVAPGAAVVWDKHRGVLVPIDTTKWHCAPLVRVPGLDIGVGAVGR